MTRVWIRTMIVALAHVPAAAAHPGHGMGADPHHGLSALFGWLPVAVVALLVAWLAARVFSATRSGVGEH